LSNASHDFWSEALKSFPPATRPPRRGLVLGALLLVLFLFLLLVTWTVLGLYWARRPSPPIVEPPRRVVVLLYHHLAPGHLIVNPHNTVSPERFDEQLGWFKAHGYETITLAELRAYMTGEPLPPSPGALAASPSPTRWAWRPDWLSPTRWPWRRGPRQRKPGVLPPRPLVITFDDGYQSNYVYAYPILRKYGYHASIDLIVSSVRDGPAASFDPAVLSYLSWDEVREMARSGLVDFQSHTYDLHREGPDGVPLTLSRPAPEVLADLIRAKAVIESETGQPVLALAYPYGRHPPELERLALEAGYGLGLTIDDGYVHRGDAVMAVKRFILSMDDTPGRLSERFADGTRP